MKPVDARASKSGKFVQRLPDGHPIGEPRGAVRYKRHELADGQATVAQRKPVQERIAGFARDVLDAQRQRVKRHLRAYAALGGIDGVVFSGRPRHGSRASRR